MKNDLRTQAVRDAFKERTYRNDKELRNKLFKGEDYKSASYIIEIEQLVREFIKSNKMFFFIDENELGRNTISCENPDCLKLINTCITGGLTTDIALSFPFHKLNPYVELFINVKDKLGNELGRGLDNYNEYRSNIKLSKELDTLKNLIITVYKLNEFVDEIRKEAEIPKKKKYMANYKANIIEINKGLVSYINYLFEKYSILLVFRVDFGYRNERPRNMKIDEITEKYKQAQNNRKDFINDKPIDIFKHRVGYVWKLEHCFIKGFYYQIYFFFDRSKIELDSSSVIKIPEEIGEYWNTTITQGKGLYVIRDNHKFNGIGLGFEIINRDSHSRRDGLEKALGDLIKPDYYAKIATPGKEKAFGKGEILKPKS